MSYARQLLDSYPGTLNADAGMLAATIDALSDCAQACCSEGRVRVVACQRSSARA